MHRLTFLHTPMFSVQNCIPPAIHKTKYGILQRKVYFDKSVLAPEHGYLTPQNGCEKLKYTARDHILQISMLYGKFFFRVMIQGKTLRGEMWHGG